MDRPHILLIMTDQHRADWLGCAGNPGVRTPHLDALAERGVRFSRASCNSPVCAPSRAALASGQYPHRTGVLHNKHNFPVDCPTYYQALRSAGYRVGVVGKTDLHKADHYYGETGELPLLYHFGFTHPHETEGKGNASKPGQRPRTKGEFPLAGPYQRHLKEHGLLQAFLDDRAKRAAQPAWHAEAAALPPEHFHDSYIGGKACEFIRQVPDDAPWHLFVSFVGPHHPWDVPAAYANAYADTVYPPGIPAAPVGKPAWIRDRMARQSEGMTDGGLQRAKQHYAGAISLIDHWVGRILEQVEERGFTDNTVVVFCSDHGEMLGDHGLFYKTVMYESALRIPLIIADPRHGRRGTVSDALAELADLHPTMLELAGVEYPRSRLDGQSLLPLMRGEEGFRKSFQISELLNSRMISDSKYKYIETYNDQPELYDLEEDPEEQRNLAGALPHVAERMLKLMKNACK